MKVWGSSGVCQPCRGEDFRPPGPSTGPSGCGELPWKTFQTLPETQAVTVGRSPVFLSPPGQRWLCCQAWRPRSRRLLPADLLLRLLPAFLLLLRLLPAFLSALSEEAFLRGGYTST